MPNPSEIERQFWSMIESGGLLPPLGVSIAAVGVNADEPVVAELNEKAAARAAYDRAVEEARQRALLAGCPAADAPTIVPLPRLSTWDQAEGE